MDSSSWYVSPEQQHRRARQLWPHAALPELPRKYTLQTRSEVPLLHLPGTFNSL
jgi:hypothetical protein